MIEPIKVIIAEDILPIRKRYVKILNSHPEIKVLADVDNGVEVCQKAKELKPDVILMDLSLIHISEPRDRQKSRMPSSA